MNEALVIVESPTKAKTISKFLGKGYKVMSSFGHIRDLPKKNLGVDVKGNFAPTYEVSPDKEKRVRELRAAAKGAKAIYLASDQDREGEAIAWHIAAVLKLKPNQIQRIAFHEITKKAIEHALSEPRAINQPLVDAQQARRVLDRLVGYELSPLLWKKVARGLSAGRVQSVAVRLVVERERERLAFKNEEYWTVEGLFKYKEVELITKLVAVDDEKLEKLSLKNSAMVEGLVSRSEKAKFLVDKIEEKEVKKQPPTPLTTSTLQQEANTRLGFGAKQTMTIAQHLYETGLISYMRTDSMTLAEEFLSAAQTFIKKTYGAEYALGAKRYHTNKPGAQEAHEAIRPTDPALTPELMKAKLDSGEARLYNLIWKRTMASQLPPAVLSRQTVDLLGERLVFRAVGSKVLFPGYMRIWLASEDKILPKMAVGDGVGSPVVKAEQHFTEPSARYSDATLVKILEEHGIGRPSTYAPTISTIIDRGYVERDDNKKLFPTEIAMIVTDLLTEHFPNVVDYNFTAEVEKDLDAVADGEKKWEKVIKEFYQPFHKNLLEKTAHLTRAEVMKETVIGTDPKTGLTIIARTGRFGPYVQVGEVSDENPKPHRASLEKNQLIQTLKLEQALKLLALPKSLGVMKSGEELVVAKGPFGLYLKGGSVNVSLPEGVDPHSLSLMEGERLFMAGMSEKAERLKPLAELGVDPTSKAIITVKDGRFGAYVTDGVINATVPKKRDPLTITLEEGLAFLEKKRKAPKRAWGKRRSITL